jgi:hypothetical protein
MVREEQFREAQANAAYNHQLLQEHLQADADLAEQAVLVDSYRSARKIRLARWRYCQRAAELAASYKECDEAADEVFCETNDEEEDIAGSAEAAPRRHDHEAGTSAGAAGSEEE